MRTLERIGFLFILCCTVALLNRAGAQDGMSGMSDGSDDGVKAGAPISTSQLNITAPDGRVVMRLGATSEGGGRIQLLNKSGKVVAQLHTRAQDDGQLLLFDGRGNLRSSVNAAQTGGYANFFTKTGSRGVYVGSDSGRDGGFVSVFDAGKARIQMYGHDNGARITASNSAGKQVLTIGAAADTGDGIVTVSSGAGRKGLALYSTSNGGQVSVENSMGKRVGFLGASSDPAGTGLMFIAGADGRRVVELGRGRSLGGVVGVFNSNQKRIVFLGTSDDATSPGDGALELYRKDGKRGVGCRAYQGGSSVSVYDSAGKGINKQLR